MIQELGNLPFFAATTLAEAIRDPVLWTSIVLFTFGCVSCQYAAPGRRALTWFGAILIIAAGGIVTTRIPMDLFHGMLAVFCGLAIAGGVGFISLREPVHAALGFTVSVLSACGILLLQGAPFLAAASVIVYAGATIIVFLFVLMFSPHSLQSIGSKGLKSPIATTASMAALIAILAIGIIVVQPDSAPEAINASSRVLESEGEGKVVGLGRSMFTDYLWTVELAGALLMAATIGAVALAHEHEDASHE